jgi:uncharacterized repeat protein (TIGR01451 family)
MIKNIRGKRVTFILITQYAIRITLLGVFFAGTGLFFVPRIHAALLTHVYPPDKNILVNRSFEPDDFSIVSSGGVITVTVDVTNNEDVALRGFYYSDQVPDGWVVDTVSVSVNGSPIADYTSGQGYAGEIYTGFTPHRWALENPQGDGAFSPTHPIPASGGTARIVYTMIVSEGTGSDYSIGHEAWAGWLETAHTGTAVFGYHALNADFTAQPRFGLPPLTVQFTDLSMGDVLTRAWDFGDEGTASLPGPTHTYSALSYYTVTLTIQDAYGSDILVRPRYIHVTDVIYNVYLPTVLRDCAP